MNFHHPYHFVPFLEPIAKLQRDDFTAGKAAHVTHARYVPQTHSGRILCSLETVTPIFVGAQRGEGSPTPVEHYKLRHEVAIPASSLRGAVTSLAEAASNSAFRVLNSRARYSVRKAMPPPEHLLSAIGVVLEGEGGKFLLQPLCIPTLRSDQNGLATLPRAYHGLFPEPNLRVYIGNSGSIRQPTFKFRTMNFESPKWYAMPLLERKWLPGFRLDNDDYQHRKPSPMRGYVLGQKALNGIADPIALEAVEQKVAAADRGDYQPGVVRVLGCWGNRTDSMPHGKRHELFLPWPQNPNWPVVELPDSVVKDFEWICASRVEASREAYKRNPEKNPLLPFEPWGSRPKREGLKVGEENQDIKLKHGDLVYFAADDTGRISEIAFSSIWRRTVRNGKEPAKASDFFPAELNPFSDKRKQITDAELLFGFVEDRKDLREEHQNHGLALASRVRFSAGIAEPGVKEFDRVKLKVLDSPKPPCPSMYFRSRKNPAGEFIGKMDLNAALHQAQGRKFYLHRDGKNQPWRSQSPDANVDQQSEVRPVTGSFSFHVDFDNLTDEELGLLIYSLAPSEGFRHKIGMGKGIGLGSVHIRPLALLEIDRKRRYTEEGMREPRYHSATLPTSPSSASLPEECRTVFATAADLMSLRDAYRKDMALQIRQAIELVGDPKNLKYPVKQPLLADQTDEESKTFQWFVANESGRVDAAGGREIPAQKQFLKPLLNAKELPALSQPVWRPRG